MPGRLQKRGGRNPRRRGGEQSVGTIELNV